MWSRTLHQTFSLPVACAHMEWAYFFHFCIYPVIIQTPSIINLNIRLQGQILLFLLYRKIRKDTTSIFGSQANKNSRSLFCLLLQPYTTGLYFSHHCAIFPQNYHIESILSLFIRAWYLGRDERQSTEDFLRSDPFLCIIANGRYWLLYIHPDTWNVYYQEWILR